MRQGTVPESVPSQDIGNPRNLGPEEVVARLKEGLGEGFEYAFVDHGRVIARVRPQSWIEAVRLAKEDPLLRCTYFSWLSAIDWTEQEIADAEAAAEEAEATEASTETGGGTTQGHSRTPGEGSSAPAGEPSGAGSTEGASSQQTEKTEAAGDRNEGKAGESGSAPSSVAGSTPQVDERGIAQYFQPRGELFEVVCHLISPERGIELTLKTAVSKDDPKLPTITDVFKGANWHERECHEMFGIVFEGHPNLSKLYLPEEFEGFPLRKSYVLGARLVKPWPGHVDVEEIPPEIEERLDALARGEVSE